MDDSLAGLRNGLADFLVREGCITSASVEAAFRAVPRHLFLPDVPPEEVYRDEAIVTKRQDGVPVSSSSQPAIMAIMLEQLDVEPGQRVLEIGAGTGYNAALLAHLAGAAGHVVSVDIDQDIVDAARAHLDAAGFGRVEVVRGDGGLGYPAAAPYDRIILTVGAWDIAPAWQEQLRPGGRLVLPLSVGGVQLSVAFAHAGNHLASLSVRECGFMRLRGAFAGPERVIALGPEPGLLLATDSPDTVDTEAVYRLLAGPGRELSTGVRVTPREVFGGLGLWLALHTPGFCSLMALGPAAGRGMVPCLFHMSGECSTRGVFDGEALCLLMRPPGASLDEPTAGEAAPFELYVRAHGPDDALAARVTGHITAWDRAGRPGAPGLRLRAYPHDTIYQPAAGETVVPKQWTRLVIGSPTTS